MTGHMWTPSDVVMVITAIFAGVSGLITVWKTTQTKNLVKTATEQSKINEQKIDEVHSLTDGNLSRTQGELQLEKKKNLYLEKLLVEVTARCPEGELDKAKKSLEEKEAKIGKRRRSDLKREQDYVG